MTDQTSYIDRGKLYCQMNIVVVDYFIFRQMGRTDILVTHD